jgi:hypothetical protein
VLGSPLQSRPDPADDLSMFGTTPHARVLMMLWTATVLGVVAVALLALAASRGVARRHTVTAAPTGSSVVWPRATPGSTAHARYAYRLSLGR